MRNLTNGNVKKDNLIKYNNNNNEPNLATGEVNTKYIIKNINTEDEEVKNFLFTLGCYKGEEIILISILSENYIINIKDAKYSIDKELAEAIQI